MKRLLLILPALLLIVSCVSAVQLPNNVTVNNNNIDSVSFEYPIHNSDLKSFKMAKVCIAEYITNEEVLLSDSSRSFVGSYTGNLYNIDSEKQIQGGQVIRMYDEDIKTVVARGSHKYNKTIGFLPMGFYLRYTLKMSFNNQQMKIRFSNIERAQGDTGYLSNSGFREVGNFPNNRPEEVYDELENISKRLKTCVD